MNEKGIGIKIQAVGFQKTTLGVLFLLAYGTAFLYGKPVPGWFIPLRDAVYEQNLGADEIFPLYQEILAKARGIIPETERYILLSRCEYMMGRAYQYEKRKDEAAERYAEGIRWAEKALEREKTAEGWQMLAENVSQSCAVRSVAWAMANGLKADGYAKKALELESRNAAAQYMVAARFVYAPAPFGNHKKGIQMMADIARENDEAMEKDDRYNVYSAIGYAYVQLRNYSDARPWIEKSLEVYPTNKFAQSLLRNL
jgi:tetratricopeptide (TPR) repeat protein